MNSKYPMPEGGIVAVIDDDDAMRESLQFLLETAGFDVHGYRSAQAFLPEADHYHWRYLLIDQHMPAVTGLELVARLRGTGHAIPALLITGSKTEEMDGQAAALGVTAVLEKPLVDADLFRYLAAV